MNALLAPHRRVIWPVWLIAALLFLDALAAGGLFRLLLDSARLPVRSNRDRVT